ncbi:MAG: bifunctional diguanylate cyclase/phosphodiesterase [Rhodocyclaceae bacterium]|nr:bifunctional diguanylate cyclase/phosphodiesterase [Rhodocyclaceae bacterium]
MTAVEGATLPGSDPQQGTGETPGTQRFSLRTRVGLGALMLTLASLLLLTLAWNGLERMERAQARAASANGLLVAGEMLLRTSGELMLSQGSLSARTGTRGAAADTRLHLEALTGEDAAMAAHMARWEAIETRLQALLDVRLIDVSDDQSLILYGGLIQGIEAFMPLVREAKQRADEEAGNALNRAAAWLVSGLIGLTVLAGFAGLTLLRMLDHQLGGDPSLARGVAQRLADGHLDAPVPVSEEHPRSVMAGLEHMRIKLLERRAIEQRVQYLARHDVLSGALNRRSFRELLDLSIEQARRAREGLAVLYIDLDRFKAINDTLGHAQGDEVIRLTATRLRHLLRRGDHLARLGGDEFAIIASQITDQDGITHLCQRILDSVSAPCTVGNREVAIGASIGVAMLDASVGGQDDLLHKADLAMYRAKENGRNGFSIYDEALDGQLRDRHELLLDLRAALGKGQLHLHYQPIYSSQSQALAGYEALLRWHHPRRGDIPPADFIPLAEEAGLIEAIGDWVLLEACSEAVRWPGPWTLSINLSVVQIESGRLPRRVAEVLARTGLPANRLELEITETLLMTHREPVDSVLSALSDLGVRLSMDDFGSGYSSLAYLWQFRFDRLKIDRQFIEGLGHDPRVDQVIGAIVSLAHGMGMRVTAEGIERDDQLAYVQASCCDEVQGFLLGRPAPPGQAASDRNDQETE